MQKYSGSPQQHFHFGKVEVEAGQCVDEYHVGVLRPEPPCRVGLHTFPSGSRKSSPLALRGPPTVGASYRDYGDLLEEELGTTPQWISPSRGPAERLTVPQGREWVSTALRGTQAAPSALRGPLAVEALFLWRGSKCGQVASTAVTILYVEYVGTISV
ncbi:hypothetical protein CAAN1_11S04973 [[Candida] anglica]|uniref:Uncharacterized protein n=1 Tax=[Candida] anglica TaxID=148631 RepID=A0ABP0EI43_9ASCO